MNSKVLLLLLLCGCASIDFVPYVGTQKAWPQSQGGFVRQVDGVDIYQGLPPRPYEILGSVRVNARSGRGEQAIAKAAKEHGADAAILDDLRSVYSGTYTSGGDSTTFGSSQTTGTIKPGYSGATYSGTTSHSLQTITSPTISTPIYRSIGKAYLIRYLDSPAAWGAEPVR